MCLSRSGCATRAFLNYAEPAVASRLVTPHRGGVSSLVLPSADLSERLVASGSLTTTAADMARRGAAVLAEPSPLLDPAHQAMLLGRSEGASKRSAPFGGLCESDRRGRLVYKNGGRDGADAYLLLALDDGLVVAVAANRFVDAFEGSTGDVAQQILGWLHRSWPRTAGPLSGHAGV